MTSEIVQVDYYNACEMNISDQGFNFCAQDNAFLPVLMWLALKPQLEYSQIGKICCNVSFSSTWLEAVLRKD